MARAVSAQKRAANRRNAQLSSGPRSEQGKRRVSLNALRHGLSSPVAPDFVGRRYPQLIELLLREEGLEEGSAQELSRKIFEYERGEAHGRRELARALEECPALAAPPDPMHNPGPKSQPKDEAPPERAAQATQAPEVHDPLTDLRLALEMAPAARRRRSAREPSALTQAQRQKLALARALAKRPALLVVNEATQGLDPAAQGRVMAGVLAASRDALVVWVIAQDDPPPGFDRALVFAEGRLMRDSAH